LFAGIALIAGRVSAAEHESTPAERSFWLHASLAPTAQKGYWGPRLPGFPAPRDEEVRSAARLLADDYAANRLYLVYHHEISLEEASRAFTLWKQHCPKTTEIISDDPPSDV